MELAAHEPNTDLHVKLRTYLEDQPEIDAVYLFGSHATGRATEGSDLDIAILVDESFDLQADPAYRLRQLSTLEQLAAQPVDLIILNRAPLVLTNQVLANGQLICERNHRHRVNFEVRSLLAYFDFKPLLDLLNRKLAQDIKEGRLATRYRGHRDPLGDARRALDRLESVTGDDF